MQPGIGWFLALSGQKKGVQRVSGGAMLVWVGDGDSERDLPEVTQ